MSNCIACLNHLLGLLYFSNIKMFAIFLCSTENSLLNILAESTNEKISTIVGFFLLFLLFCQSYFGWLSLLISEHPRQPIPLLCFSFPLLQPSRLPSQPDRQIQEEIDRPRQVHERAFCSCGQKCSTQTKMI